MFKEDLEGKEYDMMSHFHEEYLYVNGDTLNVENYFGVWLKSVNCVLCFEGKSLKSSQKLIS